jgi:flagellar biosynthetic protein FliQ
MVQSDLLMLTVILLKSALKMILPLILTGIIIGLLVSMFQSITGLQEQSLSYVPKMIAILFVLAYLAPYLIHTQLRMTREIMTQLPYLLTKM